MRFNSELIWRAEENQREAFRLMARSAVDGAVLEVEHTCMVATGVPNAFFNPVFLYRTPDEIEIFLRRIRAFYDARGGLPWTLLISQWNSENWRDTEAMLTPDRLSDAGLIAAGTVPIMARETQRGDGWSRFHPQVVVECVQDGDALSDFRDTLAEAFGVPGYVTELLMPEMPNPPLRLYIAYLYGEAVGTISLLDAAGVGGIYNLGVHPGYRRRGIATALLRHALDEACWELGLSECVIQASRVASPLLNNLGFRRIALCHRYVEPENLPPGEGQKRG